MSLARIFWVVAWANVALTVWPAVETWQHPHGEFDGLVVFGLLAIVLIEAVVMSVVALVRKRPAYWIGLALLALPTTYVVVGYSNYVISMATQPTEDEMAAARAALKARHGNFKTAANRALAEAIVAGDAAKVAALAPTANLNEVGEENMTFMRLALDDGHADPAVVMALLKAGLDPDQEDQMLLGVLDAAGVDTGRQRGVVAVKMDQPLLRAVIEAGVDLNVAPYGTPRYFNLLRWPDGLAIALEHGADIEIRDRWGSTALMVAVGWDYWPAIDVLLAHGARLDLDGPALRKRVDEKLSYIPAGSTAPAPLRALKARLQ